MCQFCIEHGDGKKWYLEAANYAYDLESDLERRGYIIEFARDFDATAARAVRYLPLVKYAPSPVRRRIHSTITSRLQQNHFGQVVPIEDCAKIFDIATSIVRVPCVCRRFAGKGEQAYCLLMTTRPLDDLSADPFVRDLAAEVLGNCEGGPDVSRFELLSREETLAMLAACEQQGLMHSIWTFVTPFIAAMCNCNLTSGCMAMRMTREFDCKIMWKAEYVAQVDLNKCAGCSDCVALCPFDALDFDEQSQKAVGRLEACYGCGICRSACAEGAISLAARSNVTEVACSW